MQLTERGGRFGCGRVKNCCILACPVISNQPDSSKEQQQQLEIKYFRPFRSEDSFPLHQACWHLLSTLHPTVSLAKNLERLLILFGRKERWPTGGGWPRGLDIDYGGIERFWSDAFKGLPDELSFMLCEPGLDAPLLINNASLLEPTTTERKMTRPISNASLGTLFTALDSDTLFHLILHLDRRTFDRLPLLSYSVRLFLLQWEGYWRSAIRIYWPWMRIRKEQGKDGGEGYYKELFRVCLQSEQVRNTERVVGVVAKYFEKELDL